jgi:hypothetical protein
LHFFLDAHRHQPIGGLGQLGSPSRRQLGDPHMLDHDCIHRGISKAMTWRTAFIPAQRPFDGLLVNS